MATFLGFQDASPQEADAISFGAFDIDCKSVNLPCNNKRKKKVQAKEMHIELLSKVGELSQFRLYDEDELSFMHVTHNGDNTPVVRFDLDKLEPDNYYDTDQEMILKGKEWLLGENYQAVNAFNKLVPEFVSNLDNDYL